MTNDQTLGDIGEFALIDLIGDVFAGSGNSGASVVLGVGDDAAVLAVPGRVVVAVDQMVEGRHFRRDWSSAHDVGRKAVARSMSDIAAMGARPVALLIGLAAPATLPVAWACELAEGMVAEADPVGHRAGNARGGFRIFFGREKRLPARGFDFRLDPRDHGSGAPDQAHVDRRHQGARRS